MELPNLPATNDESWEGAEKYTSPNKRMPICNTHGMNWKDHKGYKDNHDGTASCQHCGWGFQIPGYIRIYDGKVFDLRGQ